jgi:hypothetical protein
MTLKKGSGGRFRYDHHFQFTATPAKWARWDSTAAQPDPARNWTLTAHGSSYGNSSGARADPGESLDTSRWNRGFVRSGANVESIRSHARE